MSADLRLILMGKPRASKDGAPVDNFVYNKTLALLSYLAVTGRPHSREALAGLLWGEMPDERARANLRKVLRDLRQLVPDDLIITRQIVAFDFSAPHWLDVEVFQARLQGLQSSQEPTVFSPSEVRSLAEAVDLYTGDFMDGFYVRDAPAFEEWVVMQRERLRQLALYALYSLARYYTGRGQYAAGIDYATRLLALEPWHEEFHQQMMLLLALSGQRSAALHQYEICRSILSEELGVDPSSDTLVLFQQIQAGKVTGSRLPAVPPHNLAAPVTPFVGREKELELIAERLRRPECRLLTLAGLGGAGKTRLALQAATDALPAFTGGVHIVRLARADGAAHYPAACIGESLGLACDNCATPQACLIDYLHSRQMLLVLDDLDRPYDSLRPLVEILEGAPGVKFLVTSQERLGLPGEWVLQIGGLSPLSTHTDDPQASGAVQLFAASARRVQAGFTLEAATVPAINRIIELTEGLPLAIELAAAWVRMLPVEEIEQEIERNLDFLATTSSFVPPRQRSLRAVFGGAWEQLSDEERRVFARLSVFRGGFRREAVHRVTGATLPILAALLDHSLLQSSPSGRYDMHSFLRQYSAEKLAEDRNEFVETNDAHCAYYTEFLSRHQDEAQEIGAEMKNIQAAAAWAEGRTAFGTPSAFTEQLVQSRRILQAAILASAS